VSLSAPDEDENELPPSPWPSPTEGRGKKEQKNSEFLLPWWEKVRMRVKAQNVILV